jgi:hypothetical protein
MEAQTAILLMAPSYPKRWRFALRSGFSLHRRMEAASALRRAIEVATDTLVRLTLTAGSAFLFRHHGVAGEPRGP